VEITYGIERLCMFLNGIGNIYDIPWNERFTYGDMRREAERQFSVYDFEEARTDLAARWFDEYESESNRLLEAGLFLPAYDFCLKASHTFNILDARGAISVAARADYIKRVRRLACAAAQAYMKRYEAPETEVPRG